MQLDAGHNGRLGITPDIGIADSLRSGPSREGEMTESFPPQTHSTSLPPLALEEHGFAVVTVERNAAAARPSLRQYRLLAATDEGLEDVLFGPLNLEPDPKPEVSPSPSISATSIIINYSSPTSPTRVAVLE